MADKQPEGFHKPRATGEEEDVEGHRHLPRESVHRPREGFHKPRETGEEDDVEGHRHLPRESVHRPREGFHKPRATGEEEDVEGHSMLPNAGIARTLAQARERDIQQHLKRHDLEADARAAKKERH